MFSICSFPAIIANIHMKMFVILGEWDLTIEKVENQINPELLYNAACSASGNPLIHILTENLLQNVCSLPFACDFTCSV